jgi:tetratricopeptide (TPR) repeat protein/predicted Ser/Thr protein kinase
LNGSGPDLHIIIDVPPEQFNRTAPTDSDLGSLDLFPAPPLQDDETMQRRVLGHVFGRDVPGRMIGRYEYVRTLGSGGMGVVHLTRDPELDRLVAVKLVHKRALSPHSAERLRREAATLAKLNHVNIVTVYDVGEHEGELFIAMEHVEGSTLHDWQHGGSRRSVTELIDVYRQAAAGLAAAHRAGVVHRDFKPSNVLVGSDGRVRVADFGLAMDESRDSQAPTSTPDRSTRRTRGGTPGFMAPEVAAGERASDRADQFALCVSMCEGLSGILVGRGDILSPIRPRWLRRVLARGMSPDPRHRWPDLQTLHARLDLSRRYRPWFVGGLTGSGVIAGALLSFVFATESSLCPDPSATFDTVWSTDRRAALHEQLHASGKAWVGDLSRLLDSELEVQRERWIGARNQLCQATWVDKVRSEASLDRGNACLDRHLETIDLLLGLVEEGDEASLTRLHDQLAMLGDPRDCTRDQPARAEEHERSDLAIEWRELDELKLRVAGGNYAEVHGEVRALAARAAEVEAPLLHAETLYLITTIEARLDPTAAIDTGIRAELSAERAGADELRFEIQRRMVWIHVNFVPDVEAAHRWFERASATHDRLGSPRHLAVEFASARAEIAAVDGDLQTAAALLEEALDLAQSFGADASRIDELELALANRLADAGRREEAIARYRQIATARAKRLGAEHPDVAIPLVNLGLTLIEADRSADALPHLERVIRIRERAHGPDASSLEGTLVLMSRVQLEIGNLDEALALAKRAHGIDVRAKSSGDPARLNGSRLIVHVHLARGEYEPALAADLLALELLDDGPSTTPLKVGLHYEIGWLLCRLGRHEEAAPHLERALDQGDDVVRRQAKLALVDVHLARGQTDLALRDLDEIRPVRSEEDLEYVAQHNWLEARALIASGGSGARELLDSAEAGYRALSPRPDIAASLKELNDEE